MRTLSLYVSIYPGIAGDRLQPDAPPNELLRICRPRPDPAHFRLSDIVDVHSEAISVADLDGLAEVPEVGDGRFCKWNIVFCDGEKPRFTPVLGCGDTPPALPILEFGEILSGTGSASLGFREAGFNHRFVVEPDVTLASAFSVGHFVNISRLPTRFLDEFSDSHSQGIDRKFLLTLMVRAADTAIPISSFVDQLRYEKWASTFQGHFREVY